MLQIRVDPDELHATKRFERSLTNTGAPGGKIKAEHISAYLRPVSVHGAIAKVVQARFEKINAEAWCQRPRDRPHQHGR